MTHKEKLDKVLYLLYPYRFNNSLLALRELMSKEEIHFGKNEPLIISQRLKEDGFIKSTETLGGEVYVKLTSYGIEYCEEESYSLPNKSVINLFNISNSPSSTVIVGDGNSIEYTNTDKIQNSISELKVRIVESEELTEVIVKEIGECLDEIDDKVKRKQRIPKMLVKGLLSTSADMITIHPYVQKLVDLINNNI